MIRCVGYDVFSASNERMNWLAHCVCAFMVNWLLVFSVFLVWYRRCDIHETSQERGNWQHVEECDIVFPEDYIGTAKFLCFSLLFWHCITVFARLEIIIERHHCHIACCQPFLICHNSFSKFRDYWILESFPFKIKSITQADSKVIFLKKSVPARIVVFILCSLPPTLREYTMSWLLRINDFCKVCWELNNLKEASDFTTRERVGITFAI